MQLPRPDPRPANDDKLIPLINIVFLLLIFFMLAGALSRPDVLGVTPAESQSGLPATPDEAVLSVAADGRMALDGVAVGADQLSTRVRALQAERPELSLKLKADADLSADRLLPLLDELREAGVERLVLLTVAGEA
jgi:biopolymer transport protein ExbD